MATPQRFYYDGHIVYNLGVSPALLVDTKNVSWCRAVVGLSAYSPRHSCLMAVGYRYYPSRKGSFRKGGRENEKTLKGRQLNITQSIIGQNGLLLRSR